MYNFLHTIKYIFLHNYKVKDIIHYTYQHISYIYIMIHVYYFNLIQNHYLLHFKLIYSQIQNITIDHNYYRNIYYQILQYHLDTINSKCLSNLLHNIFYVLFHLHHNHVYIPLMQENKKTYFIISYNHYCNIII